MFFCLMKYKDNSSNTVQVPFIIAFILGNIKIATGSTAGAGNIFRFNITTTANTKIETPATIRNQTFLF